MEDNTEYNVEYLDFIDYFLSGEIKNDFERSITGDENAFLDGYALENMNCMCNNITGLIDNPAIRDYIFNDLRLALRVGYAFSCAQNRYGLEHPEFKKYLEMRNKFSIKKYIVKILDRIANKLR